MTDELSSTRLNKRLALLLGTSRREADDLIAAGRVLVNKKVAVLGARVNADSLIAVDNKPITETASLRYIVFNKPTGYVCSRKAQGDSPTIYELLPQEMHALKPVGRLDKDSSGLLLLTNDGDFAHSMTHPSFQKVKVYDVTIDRPLEPLHQQMISDYGIEIGDGTSKLSLERKSDDRTEWVVTMHEGRNRQIRRTFSSLGYTVTRLNRLSFGPYGLQSLQTGDYVATERK